MTPTHVVSQYRFLFLKQQSDENTPSQFLSFLSHKHSKLIVVIYLPLDISNLFEMANFAYI